MTKVAYIEDYRDTPTDCSKMVARAQQENDGIPRYVVNPQRTADKALKNPEFRKSVLADMPLDKSFNTIFNGDDAA